MPIYEFVCESCGRLTEIMQKVSDPPPGPCGECGGRVARMVSRTSFQLKGGGWYADLYSSAKEKPAPPAKPDAPAAAGEAKPGATPAAPAATPAAASPAPAKPAPSGGTSGGGSGGTGGAGT